jgi:hypothetical protein
MTETIHCPSCGVEIEGDASSCLFCGAALRPEFAQMATDVSPTAHRVAHENRPAQKDRSAQTMERYREGYVHARAINAFGATVKMAALIPGVILVYAGYEVFGSSGSGSVIGVFGGVAIALAGFLLGGLGWVLGVLVQSAGQSMKAHFDCAVNGSHFLNDDQRAEVMSLK